MGALARCRKDFAVMQPFPAAISAEEADPFLMCDLFGPTVSAGKETDPDKYMVVSVCWTPRLTHTHKHTHTHTHTHAHTHTYIHTHKHVRVE